MLNLTVSVVRQPPARREGLVGRIPNILGLQKWLVRWFARTTQEDRKHRMGAHEYLNAVRKSPALQARAARNIYRPA
jgi:hypothetical protein